jgi:hypothetical protein
MLYTMQVGYNGYAILLEELMESQRGNHEFPRLQ